MRRDGKIGPAPSNGTRRTEATIEATATGIKLRGFHSNNNSSTASKTAATGVAKTADMPAAAPATSNVLRSAALRWNCCAKSEPNAPPVMMIGPSAPNGPPVPMEMAEESGLSSATFRSNPAAAEQNGLQRLGNAVPANFLRAKPRHQPDDQRARHRHQHHPQSQMISCGIAGRRGQALIKSEVRDGGDQPDQSRGDQAN